MKTIHVKIPKTNILKESTEERLDRVHRSSAHLLTKITPNKKQFSKKKQRQKDNLEVKRYL